MYIGILIVCVIIAIVGWAITIYNGLIELKVRAENAWSDIDVQLKRRHDLVPNLVEAVQGYAKHERGTLQAVIEARNQAISSQGILQKGQSENQLANSLKSLFAVVEQYPDLKANEGFLKLHSSLIEIEETIQSARRYYNAVVRDLNILIQVFPASLVAGAFHFTKREFFQLNDVPSERQAPQVKIDL